MNEKIDHPAHYGGADNPYEAIKVIKAWGLGFSLGNTLKYIARHGKKRVFPLDLGSREAVDQFYKSAIEDLQKAAWYLNDEIETLRREQLERDLERGELTPAVNEAIARTAHDIAQSVGLAKGMPQFTGPAFGPLETDDGGRKDRIAEGRNDALFHPEYLMPISHSEIPVLDHGYVKFIEAWGHGLDGEMANDLEVGIIEAARESTDKGFLGWELTCEKCGGAGFQTGTALSTPCKHCRGIGRRGDEFLLEHLYKHKHSTPFEFAGMTIEIQAPIAVFREWHRHRTQSYAEMSARYVPLPDFNYMPDPERCLIVNKQNKQAGAMDGAEELTHEAVLRWLHLLGNAYKEAEYAYQQGLKVGIPKEVARMCVPVGRYSRMRASTDLRNWLGFLTLRSAPDAQWEIRQFSNVVGLQLIAELFPRTWALFNK